ncbi:MAG: FAD binding domain-containing protein [Candidatus Heimdallarchaeaceae archaeon]
MKFILNQQIVEIDAPLGSSTLDFLRNKGMKGVKEACHEGECGACMILLGELKGKDIEYKAVTSCILPIGEIVGKHVVTIEGLNQAGLNPIQESFIKHGAVQCGFCTPSFIVSLTGFFLSENYKKENILTAIEGNLCRCGTYAAIRRAAEELAERISVEHQNSEERIKTLIELGVLPAYFADIQKRLQNLNDTLKISQEQGTYVAGATDLLVQKETVKSPIFLSKKNLRADIWEEDDYIYIGALTNMEDIRISEKLNELFNIKEHLAVVSALPVRNKATLGGNLVNASPIGDLTIYFLALDAEICLVRDHNRRIIKLKDFYLDYKKMDMQDGEIVEWLRIKNHKRYFNFEKVAQRQYVDIASVNSAISFTLADNKLHDVHLSAGGVAPVPKYLEKTLMFLENKEISVDVIKKAAKIADSEISPISDVRGSAKYKRLLLRQLIYAHFITLFPELEEVLI